MSPGPAPASTPDRPAPTPPPAYAAASASYQRASVMQPFARDWLDIYGLVALRSWSVKGGVKLDQCGGVKIDHCVGSWGFGLRDLRGRLERRPAARRAGRG